MCAHYQRLSLRFSHFEPLDPTSSQPNTAACQGKSYIANKEATDKRSYKSVVHLY